ncbi:MAG: GAF domain-containing protein [Clostridia bacterium]|nr:GAF domain-containing protein [Clostridia bacterium]
MDYAELNSALSALVGGVPHRIANLANASALLYSSLDRLNWAGFYEVGDVKLVLGPFQGLPACIEIPMGRGVCGTAAKEGRTLVVGNVHEFPGHIACDEASRSEIVVPVRVDGRVAYVLDIDSPEYARFDEKDRVGLEEFAAVMEKALAACTD